MAAPKTSSSDPVGQQGLIAQLQGLDNRFWIVNIMEMFERLAYYGVRAVVAIYMVLALEEGGPQFTHTQKGTIFAGWAFVQSMLPVFTGGFADRYGHKKTIAIAIAIKIVGYLFMAFFHSYGLFYVGCMLLAAGTAIFKPGVQGTLAATLKKDNASVGWGMFYQLVNVGGFLGPVVAGYLRLLDWQYVFIACAFIVAVNYLWLPFYDDPTQDADAVDEAGQQKNWSLVSQSISHTWAKTLLAFWCVLTAVTLYRMGMEPNLPNGQLVVMTGVFVVALGLFVRSKDRLDEGHTDALSVFVVSAAGMFQHRVLWFCAVFSGFWFMFNQVFDLLPNVIDDWVDSSGVIGSLGSAFATPALPTALAVFLGFVYGGVCAAGVYLATRPDRRPTEDIPPPAYIVVALALTGAFFPAISAMAGGSVVLGFLLPVLAGCLVAFVARLMRAKGQSVAIAAWIIASLGAFLSVRSTLLESSPELVRLAAEGQQVNPEWMINLNPGLIVFTMVGFAYLSGFVRPMVSILIGMLVATIGSFLAGTATLGWVCLAGILVFSVGEMLSSPKKMEYLATLARKGQEGLFMGYANVPVAIGWVLGSLVAGSAYEEHGDKVNLAKRHMVEELGMSADAVGALQKTEVMPTLAEQLGGSVVEAQHMLFATYRPDKIWWGIASIGVISIVGMVIYDRAIRWVDAREAAEG
jgi:dipeptide/tripeptide permease